MPWLPPVTTTNCEEESTVFRFFTYDALRYLAPTNAGSGRALSTSVLPPLYAQSFRLFRLVFAKYGLAHRAAARYLEALYGGSYPHWGRFYLYCGHRISLHWRRTMRITEQISALEVMGINATSYLVLPRILAAIFMFPLLVILAMALSILGGYLAGTLSGVMAATDYIEGIRTDFIPYNIA
nr:hypothetical protein [Tanacetum cinerariifolium]